MDSVRRTIGEMLRDPRPIGGGDGNDDPKDPKDPDPKDPDPSDPKDPADELEEISVPEGADEELKKVISKRNSELRALRARLKEAEPLARKAKELEDASKSETQKLTERTTAAEKRAQAAELRALRLEVASDKGLTPALAKRLTGSSKEEIEADADELLEAFGPKDGDPKRGPGGKPRERLTGGTDPTQEPEETDPRKLADAVPRT